MSRKLFYIAIVLLLFAPLSVLGACPADGFISCDPLEPVPQPGDLLIIDDVSDTSESNSVEIGNLGAAIRGLATFEITGSINVTASTAVVGVGTSFLTELRIGDSITIQDTETRLITVITDATNLTVSVAFTDLADDSAVDALPAPLRVEDSSGALLAVVDSTGDLFVKAGDAYVEDAAPDIHFRDTDSTDPDINASLVVAATDTGTGAEDVDFSVHQQVAGTLQRTIFSDADQGIWLYPSGITTTPFVIKTASTELNSATPTFNIFDIDASDGDINAQILFAATDSSSTNEDIDVTFSQQIAGNLTAWLTADADSNITFGSGRGVVADGGGSLTGTWSDLGTVSTIDIDGGSIDGVTIGSNSVATVISVDNITLDGNTITSISGNLSLTVPNNGKVVFLSTGTPTADTVIWQMGTGDDATRYQLDEDGDSVQDGKSRATWFDPSDVLSLGSDVSTGYAFNRLRISDTTAYAIQTETADTDAATFALSLIAQAAGASSTSNKTGANLNLTGGAGASGAADSDGGSVLITAGAGFGTGTPGTITPLAAGTADANVIILSVGTGDDASRWSLDEDGDSEQDGHIKVLGSATLGGGGATTYAANRLGVSQHLSFTIQGESRSADSVVNDINIIAQKAFATVGSTNDDGGSLNFTGGDGCSGCSTAAQGGGLNFTTGASFGTGDPKPFVFLSNISSGTGNLVIWQIGNADDADEFHIDLEGDVFTGQSLISLGPQRTFGSTGDLVSGDKYNFNSSASSELTGTDGEQSFFSIDPTINQSGTAAYNALKVDVIETAIGDGSTGDGNNLLNLAVGGTSKYKVDRLGDVTGNSFSGTLQTTDVAAALPVADATSLVTFGTAKEMRIDVGAITDSTTRVLTMPDADIDLTVATGDYATAAEGDLAASAMQDLSDDSTPSLAGELDHNGNCIGDGILEILCFAETGTAVNEVTITNNAAGSGPTISATGGDTNIALNLQSKADLGINLITAVTTADRNILTVSSTAQANALLLDEDGDLTVIGDVTGVNLTGTLQTAAQANITSVGTLTSITTSGDIIPSIDGAGLVYGSMYNTASITVPISNTNPTEVNDGTATFDGFVTGLLNGFTFPTGGEEHFITVTTVGVYEICWGMTVGRGAGASMQTHGGVMIDSSAVRNNGEKRRDLPTTDTGDMSVCSFHDAPNGTEEFSVWVIMGDGAEDAIIEHVTLTAKLIGGT